MATAVSKFEVLFSFTDTYSFILKDKAHGFYWKPTIYTFLTLSNPVFLPPAHSPALIYFGWQRGWWITVLKEKNVNMNSPDDFIIYFRLLKIPFSLSPRSLFLEFLFLTLPTS
jgi:hypothetical protein